MLKAIVGLPGSGKSGLMHGMKGFIILDDMGDDRTWGSGAWQKNIELVYHCLEKGYDVVVSDVGFCEDEKRKWFRAQFPTVQWEFFENDPEPCVENVTRRYPLEPRTHSLEAEIDTIKRLSQVYNPGDNRHKCYRPPS